VEIWGHPSIMPWIDIDRRSVNALSIVFAAALRLTPTNIVKNKSRAFWNSRNFVKPNALAILQSTTSSVP
jgi:hypothetical protein